MYRIKSQPIVLAAVAAVAGAVLCSCNPVHNRVAANQAKGQIDVNVKPFGETSEGQQVRL